MDIGQRKTPGQVEIENWSSLFEEEDEEEGVTLLFFSNQGGGWGERGGTKELPWLEQWKRSSRKRRKELICLELIYSNGGAAGVVVGGEIYRAWSLSFPIKEVVVEEEKEGDTLLGAGLFQLRRRKRKELPCFLEAYLLQLMRRRRKQRRKEIPCLKLFFSNWGIRGIGGRREGKTSYLAWSWSAPINEEV